MAAPPDNQFAMKFKTPEERQAVCRAYCEHISNGLSDASFPACDADTLERYIADFPEDFPSEEITKAKRARMLFWEDVGKEGTLGKIQGFNAASWKFNMQNRFKWKDRTDSTTDDKPIQAFSLADLLKKADD